MLTLGRVLCAPISIQGRRGYIKAQSWRWGIVMKLFVGLALLPLLANAITDNNYYSNSGGTSNTCSIVSCATEFTKCSNTGFYLFGCGKDPNDPNAAANNYASKGTCTACSNKPANSAYTSNASPLYTNTCSWTCNSGYAVSGTGASATCLTTTCPTPADSNADVSGTNPTCSYFCKPGYFGTADATTPNKCQPCSVGSYSASNGMTICTSCVAGKLAVALARQTRSPHARTALPGRMD
jgi:hypothetical protein